MNQEFPFQKNLLRIPHYRIIAWIVAGTVFGWAAFAVVILKLDPFTQPQFALPLFFISFFVALSGSFTLLLAFIKKWRAKDQIYIKHIMISLRQGILLSLCTTLSSGLLMLGVLRIWNGLLLVVLMMLIEFYLSGKDEF